MCIHDGLRLGRCRYADLLLGENEEDSSKKILEHCTKALRLQKKILESNDSIQKKMVQYTEVIMECYKSSHEETGKIIKGLGDIVKAVEAEERKKNGEMQNMRSRDQMDQDVIREGNARGS